jgi:DNA-binding MarR family transcriptional regulator
VTSDATTPEAALPGDTPSDGLLLDGDLPRRLSAALGLLARRLRPVRGELAMGHFSTLAWLDRHGPQRVGDLARAERVSAPVMTRIVTTLADRGLVVRSRTCEDARGVLIEVTPDGLAMVAEARAERTAAAAALLGRLDHAERVALAGALEALERLAGLAEPGPEGGNVDGGSPGFVTARGGAQDKRPGD